MHLSPLSNQVIFKKLFRDPEVLTAFVNDLTGLDVEIRADQIELEKQFDPPMGGIRIKFDIFAQLPKERIVVELQKIRYDYHYDRFLHYHLAAIMELQKSHQLYQLHQKVYTIVWLTARSVDPIYRKGLITTRYLSEAADGEILDLYPHKIYFLNPNYPHPKIPKPIADWLELAEQSMRHPSSPQINFSRPIFQKAATLIEADNLTPDERADVMDENDYQNRRRTDRKQAREEGLKEGIKEGRLEIVRSMLAEGLTLATIAKYSGLSAEQVAALSQELIKS